MARLRPGLLWTLAAVACARESDPARDVAIYSEILANAGQDPESELARCAALGDEDLAADCAAVVATAAAHRTGDTGWCARAPAGKWRDECSFQTAERALSTTGAAAAASLCQQSGAFEADCVVHVWRPQLGNLVQGMGSADFAARYPAAEALYQQTAAQVRDQRALEATFWHSFFGSGFRNAGAIEPERCQGLPEAGQARCELTAAVMLTEPLERILRQQGLLQQFCNLSPPRAQDVAGLLGVAPSAALDQALVEQQPMLCGASGGPALSSGLRTSAGQPNQVAPGW